MHEKRLPATRMFSCEAVWLRKMPARQPIRCPLCVWSMPLTVFALMSTWRPPWVPKCDRVRICTREEGVARDDAVFENRETDRPAVLVDCKRVARDDHIPIADQVFAVEAFAERRLREPVPPGLDRRVGRLEDVVSDRDVIPENVESVCAGAAGARIRVVRPVTVVKPKTLDEVAAHQRELVNPYVGVYGRGNRLRKG
jgi:hypothetical protein